MKIVANKLNDELRDELIRYVGDWVANLPADARIEVEVRRGSHDVTRLPPNDMLASVPTDEWTLQILVNGGAKDEPL